MNTPMVDMIGTGKNITSLRKRHGMTVRDLQLAFGFETPRAIYKWQTGTSLPTIDNLLVLSSLFGVTINDIVATKFAA